MPADLSRIIRELKQETCPPRVRDEVRGRIHPQPNSPGRWWRIIPAMAAGLALVGGILVWQWPAGDEARLKTEMTRATPSHVQIASQTEAALGLIGGLLAEASAHSEQVISSRAVPPLRNGLRIAKNKIIEHLKP